MDGGLFTVTVLGKTTKFIGTAFEYNFFFLYKIESKE